VKTLLSPKPFAKTAVGAFPFAYRGLATQAERALASFVDDNYRKPSIWVQIGSASVYIPSRLHFKRIDHDFSLDELSLGAKALLTRSTDGYLRQRALRTIIDIQQPWVAPFVVLLVGEYVVEIVEDILNSLGTLDRAIYTEFVRENRQLMRIIRSRAASYWDLYYRGEYPDRRAYPALVILQELERSAS
jgi:hypothetical protein